MGGQSVHVLNALDVAKTQWYHFTAIVIAGMGFFTDSYDLFCISLVTKLLGRIYYTEGYDKPGSLPANVSAAINGVAFCGSLAGQLFFGWLGDKMGRKRVYGMTLMLMVISSIASGLSFGKDPKAVMATLCFFRFWLGFGIGGDYPLSATIMAEYANKKTRGAFIAAVFAMQGFGILAGGVVAIVVSAIFSAIYPSPTFQVNPILSTVPQADYVWRMILMFGAIPVSYTHLDVYKSQVYKIARASTLLALCSTVPGYWFTVALIDRMGSQNLFQKDIFSAIGWIPAAKTMNAIEEVYKIARAQTLIALCSTVPGYWFTVALIDRMGRFTIQLMGFFFMTVFMLALAIPYHHWTMSGNQIGFVVIYSLTFFFANFGPNATTFVVPAEIFPARLRSTCHGISAAAGKAGAMVGAFGFLYAQNAIGLRNTLIILSAINFFGFLFTFLIPESKGKSLEEMSGEAEQNDTPATASPMEAGLEVRTSV
ncbi:MFS transporter [Vigna unguiculata]|uniref:MFS transporter n=1 Tax=Vigna unguiculata TaxID=3917 RepID=A0A4D6MH84_VIGUN|nr:MFS transporter [Vigna unguiculata]